ncbi:unnamed protein product [Peniophora sp. CBMAI 1063]|nr:unnamed protein product [Peniophora sp. CBMAI 1063]
MTASFPLRVALTLVGLVSGSCGHEHASADHHSHLRFNTLAVFGDSYTDTGNPSNNGTQWPTYAAGYTGASLYSFAHVGARCSEDLTPRPGSYAIVQNEIPDYLEGIRNGSVRMFPESTLHTLWIGTNDIGPRSILTGGDVAHNATIVDVTECAVDWVSTLYQQGARNFLFQNMVPQERLPIYQTQAYYTKWWTAQRNATSWNIMVKNLVAAGNALSKLMLKALPLHLPGAHIGYFDSHGLFTDILDHPERYLNGTKPYNVTGAAFACVYQVNESLSDPGDCTSNWGSDADSFVWYNELHPSEQSDRIVAREIAKVLEGTESRWVTWFS